MGPFGPPFCGDLVEYRFGQIPHQKEFAEYLYQVNAAPSSGEAILFKLFLQGAYAKQPLIDRMKELRCPVTFLYGRHDWMDVRAGRNASEIIRTEGFRSYVYVVEDAGHQLFVENPPLFCKAILMDTLQDALDDSKDNQKFEILVNELN
jgi:cardiolipin-specific phospholipase